MEIAERNYEELNNGNTYLPTHLARQEVDQKLRVGIESRRNSKRGRLRRALNLKKREA